MADRVSNDMYSGSPLPNPETLQRRQQVGARAKVRTSAGRNTGWPSSTQPSKQHQNIATSYEEDHQQENNWDKSMFADSTNGDDEEDELALVEPGHEPYTNLAPMHPITMPSAFTTRRSGADHTQSTARPYGLPLEAPTVNIQKQILQMKHQPETKAFLQKTVVAGSPMMSSQYTKPNLKATARFQPSKTSVQQGGLPEAGDHNRNRNLERFEGEGVNIEQPQLSRFPEQPQAPQSDFYSSASIPSGNDRYDSDHSDNSDETQHTPRAKGKTANPAIIYKMTDNKKRPSPELDYDSETLAKMSYSQLNTQSFDEVPKSAARTNTEALPDPNLSLDQKLLQHAECDAEDQALFFREMPIGDWEESGDWFLGQFGDIMKSLKEHRVKKRQMWKNFEDEVEAREAAVRTNVEAVDENLSKMKQGVMGILQN